MRLAFRAVYKVWVGVGALAALAGCGGEITAVELGNQQESSFDRYKAEIQPILEMEDVLPGDPPAPFSRNCAASYCHGRPGGFGMLEVLPDPDNDQLIKNLQSVQNLVDPDDPEASLLLTDPLYGPGPNENGSSHFPKCFVDENDCCYRTLVAWIGNQPKPTDCACPPEAP